MPVCSGVKVVRQLINPQFTLNLLRPVTTQTMLRKKRLKRFSRRNGVGSDGVDRSAQTPDSHGREDSYEIC
jgi:hypothetical protein